MQSSTQTLIANYAEVVDFLSGRTGSRDSAQDCAQETYLKLASAQVPEAFNCIKAYVFRVASNVAIDWHRRNARERALVDDYATMSGTETHPDTLDTVSACQTIRRLEAAILALPLRAQQVFLLHKLEGHTHGETAELLSISVKAVEKHMARVLLACRAALKA